MMLFQGRLRTPAFVAVVIATAIQARQAIGQTASSNAGLQGGQDGMFDAILATPNYRTPVLPDSALATAPGFEQAVPTPQFTLNALAPALYNSNAQFLSSGGSKTLEGSPLVRLGWASQLFDTPIRVSGAAASKPRGLSTPPAPLLTTSGLRPGHSTSIPKTTRIIRRSCPMCRDSILTRLLPTTLRRGRI